MWSSPSGFPFSIKTPESPWGCLWYFFGFCLFVLLILAARKWMF